MNPLAGVPSRCRTTPRAIDGPGVVNRLAQAIGDAHAAFLLRPRERSCVALDLPAVESALVAPDQIDTLAATGLLDRTEYLVAARTVQDPRGRELSGVTHD